MSSSLNHKQRKKRVTPTTLVANSSSSNAVAATTVNIDTIASRRRVPSGKTNPKFIFHSSSDEEEQESDDDDEVVIEKVVPSPNKKSPSVKATKGAAATPATAATTTTTTPDYTPSQMMMMTNSQKKDKLTTSTELSHNNNGTNRHQQEEHQSPQKKKRRVQLTTTQTPPTKTPAYHREEEEEEQEEHEQQQQQEEEENDIINDDDAANDDDDDNQEEMVDLDHINTPTTKELASLCWNCHVTLKMPQSPTKKELKLCWNAMHVHPLLNVPICVVCVNELANQDDAEEDDEDVCHGCASAGGDGDGGSSSLLFMCDDCPRSFCPTCVAKSNGGGKKGRKAIRRLQKDTDGKWSCPACSPPSPLQKLQESLEAVTNQDDNDNDDNDSTTSGNKNKQQRSQEDILYELELVEQEMQQRQQLAEDVNAIRQRREEIADEIRRDKPNLSQKKLDALVEEEMLAWEDLDRKHEIRLADMATSLQDELEGVYGFDLARVYKQITPTNAQQQQQQKQSHQESGDNLKEQQDDDPDVDDSDIEPEWKKKADAVITKRNLEERKNSRNTKQPTVFSPDVYRRETYDDVEDLMTKPEDERCPGDSFRSTQEKPTMEEITMCMEIEDHILQERHITIRRSVDNTTDTKDMEEEEKLISKRGAGGVSRVKRDIIMGMQQQLSGVLNIRSKKQKKKKQQQQQQLKPAPPPPPSPPPAAPEEHSQQQQQPQEDEVPPPPSRAAASEAVKTEAVSPPLAAAAGDKTAQKAVVDLTDDTTVVQKVKPATQQEQVNNNNNKTVVKKEGMGATTNKKAPRGRIEFLTVDSDDDDNDNQKKGTAGKKSEDEEYYCPSDPEFTESDVILSSPELMQSSSGRVKTIAVTTKLTQFLKPHQKEGVKFMWKNACIDLNVRTKRDEEVHEEKEVGGCILAHSMGLGKSLTAITLMYTMFNHPGLQCKEGKGLIHTILLVVPVNTIASWKCEFNKWTHKLQPSVLIYDLAEHNSNSRQHVIAQWLNLGGVLLVSKDSFQQMVKKHPTLQQPGPDAVILDEAHQCLSNRNSVIYKALSGIKTVRRLLLTGSPFQNNALEYYRMVHWMRKNVLDDSEAAFERDFATPISQGMPSDASPAAVAQCALKSTQLKNILSPYVHRKDASVLRESLPPLQQVILHVRQSKMQANLYRALARHEERYEITSFFKRYHLARPIHNHPACLLMKSRSEDPYENAVEQEESLRGSKPWWSKFVEKRGEDKVMAPSSSKKVVLLLHILAHSIKIGDKVIVFSQCLKTLDYIEHVLQLESWQDHVKSLKEEFPDMNLGGWTKGVDYLRIDGAIDAVKRGDLIKQFNRVGERVQVFLISSKAGGIGITLTAANRVVLFDSHFNPVVMNQALFRCYRFGQMKPVFAYRLLTEGTGEEKVYTRSVNKTGLSLRVIDGKNLKSFFTEKELENIEMNDTWAQCDRCEKWRMLKGEAEDDLPERWFCEMNKNDPVNNNCDASEKDNRWYHQHFQLKRVDLGAVGTGVANVPSAEHQYAIVKGESAGEAGTNPAELAGKEALARRDEILSKLVLSCDPSDEAKKNKHISKYYFHESLLEECEDSDTAAAAATETSEGSKEAVADGDRKPAAKATPTPVPSTLAEKKEQSNEDVANAHTQPAATVAETASITTQKSNTQKKKKKKKASETVQVPASEAALVKSAPVAAQEAQQKPTKKISSKAHQAEIAHTTNTTKKMSSKAHQAEIAYMTTTTTTAAAAGSTSSSTQKSAMKRNSTASSSTPKLTKKPDSSSFSVTRFNRSSSKASTATSSSKSKPAASAAVKESPLASATRMHKKSATADGRHESPSTRSRSTSLDDGNGSITRFSPRLKNVKPNANEGINKSMAKTKKRKRDKSSSSSSHSSKSSSSKSARRRLDASLEGDGQGNTKVKHKSRKHSNSSKSKKKEAKQPVIVLLETSSDEE